MAFIIKKSVQVVAVGCATAFVSNGKYYDVGLLDAVNLDSDQVIAENNERALSVQPPDCQAFQCTAGCWNNERKPCQCLNPTTGFPGAGEEACQRKKGIWCGSTDGLSVPTHIPSYVCPATCPYGCWNNRLKPNLCLNPEMGYPSVNEASCIGKGGKWCGDIPSDKMQRKQQSQCLKPAAAAATSMWVKGVNGLSCDTVCNNHMTGATCDSNRQSELTTKSAVTAAFREAGYECLNYGGTRNYGGAPFSTGRGSYDCYGIGSGAKSSCTENSMGHHSALCSCTQYPTFGPMRVFQSRALEEDKDENDTRTPKDSVEAQKKHGFLSPKYVYQEENRGHQMVDFQPQELVSPQEPDLDQQSDEEKVRRQPVPAAAEPKKKSAPQPRISNNPQILRKLSV